MRKNLRSIARKRRHARLRRHLAGTTERPRLNVYRSLANIYAQIIDDSKGHTLVSASSLDAAVKEKCSYGGNKEAAKAVGELVAQRALEQGIKEVVFDRGGQIYHGRIAALAEGAREAGLTF